MSNLKTMLEEGTMCQRMKQHKGLDKPGKAMCNCITTRESSNHITETNNDKKEKVEFCTAHLACFKRDNKDKITSFDKNGKRYCMHWVSTRPSVIDTNRAGAFAENYFKAKDLIGLHIGWKCDKHIADNHTKSMKFFTYHVINFPGDDMERTLGLGIK